MQVRCGIWKNAGKERKITSLIMADKSDNQVSFEVFAAIPAGESSLMTRYTIFGNGNT